MEHLRTSYETLLAYLQEEDYDDLIFWENLKKNGYKFHFIIDADVINKYCFPRGINSIRITNHELTESYFHDEQVALFSLFYLNDDEQKIVILDEYIPEIKHMINSATFKKFEKDPKQIISQLKIDDYKDKTENFIKYHYSEVVGTVLENIGGLQKIKDLLNEHKFVIDSTDFRSDYVQQVFDTEKGSGDLLALISRLFTRPKQYVELDLFEEEYSTIDKKVDSKAIERTIEINNRIVSENQQGGSKIIFLFFGDSPMIQNVFKKISLYSEYPMVKNVEIPLYCSTQQYFAYLISKEYKEGKVNHNKTIENLIALKEKSKRISELYNYQFNKTISLNDKMFNNYKTLRNSLENIGLFKNIGLLENKFLDLFKKNDLGNITTIFEDIIARKSELKRSLGIEWIQILGRMEVEAERNKSFLNLIDKVRSGRGNFNIGRGGDEIEGTYQLLPIFINFHDSPHSSKYNEAIFLITELVLKGNINNSAVVCDKIEDLLNELGRVKFFGKYPRELKLIKALIYLVLPIESNVNKFANDEEVYGWVLEANKIDPHSNDQKSDFSEFLYLSCWVTRRVQRYEESISYANAGIERFSKDPRFFHGKALALYCKYFSKKEGRSKELLEEIILNTENAFYLYSLYIVHNYSEIHQSFLTEKIKECFYNNLSFFYSELSMYDLNKDIGRINIIIARKYLNNLKNIQKGNPVRLPEYFDTEANVELVESQFRKGEDAIKKLRHASSAIEKAIEYSSTGSQNFKYFETYNKIRIRLQNLENHYNNDD